MKNLKKYNLKCPYCGAPAICRPASSVYGANTIDRGSYLYVCSRWPACDSYVSAHKKDRKPMGTMANRSLRQKHILAHQALKGCRKNGIWTNGPLIYGSRQSWALMKAMPISVCFQNRCVRRSFPCAVRL